MKKDLAKAKRRSPGCRKATGFDGEAGSVDPNLAGQVVEVNDQWNFVVLNLGRVNRVPRT